MDITLVWIHYIIVRKKGKISIKYLTFVMKDEFVDGEMEDINIAK